MINLTIFYDPHDPEVMAIYDQYWTMLRRQLMNRPDTSMGVDNLLYVIHSCLNTLPNIAECLNPLKMRDQIINFGRVSMIKWIELDIKATADCYESPSHDMKEKSH